MRAGPGMPGVLAWGDFQNRALVDAIDRQCHTPARLSDTLGVPIQAREALAMVVLGALCADGIPITLPQVTGCTDPAPVAGTWCLPHGLLGHHDEASEPIGPP